MVSVDVLSFRTDSSGLQRWKWIGDTPTKSGFDTQALYFNIGVSPVDSFYRLSKHLYEATFPLSITE